MMKMNTYQVVSKEELMAYDHIDFGIDVPEPYFIVELVVARTYSQARLLAWKNDKDSYYTDITEMPLMRTNIVKKDVDGPARLVTNEAEWQQLWKE